MGWKDMIKTVMRRNQLLSFSTASFYFILFLLFWIWEWDFCSDMKGYKFDVGHAHSMSHRIGMR